MSSRNPDEPETRATAGEAAAAFPDYPAYAIARSLIQVCGELAPALADLSAYYSADLDIVQGAVWGLAPLAALLHDDAPLLGAYSDLLEIAHITHTIGERSARIDWSAARPNEPKAAAQLISELVSLLLLAMERDDKMAQIRLSAALTAN